MINGICPVKEGVPEINSSVTLLIDHVVKKFLKWFLKYIQLVVSVISINQDLFVMRSFRF